MKLPRAPKAVVFDLDGTLVDSEALVRSGYMAAAPRFGIEMTDAQFLSLVGLHRAANDAQLLGYYGANFPLADFYGAVREHIGDAPAVLKPGAAALLDRLDALALPYALATSSGRAWVDKQFAAHALTDRFRVVVSRDDVLNGKPDPEPYVKAVAALGVAPADALALEDSFAGVTSAHAAGLMTVMVPDLLLATDEMRAKALHVADSLDDVVRYFVPSSP